MKNLFLVLAFLALTSCSSSGNSQITSSVTTEQSFTLPEQTGVTVSGKSVFNKIQYSVFIPSSYTPDKATAMILALHGGGQGSYGQAKENPSLFADYTRLNECAEKYGVIIVYPRQSTENHMMGLDYWNWYLMQEKDSAEPRALSGIVGEVKKTYNIDEQKVFVCGLSAGAAMAEIMLINYAQVFAGGCCVAGITYKSYAGIADATNAQQDGPTVPDELVADRIANVLRNKGRSATPKMLVAVGDSDGTVNPLNSITMANSWALAVNEINESIDIKKNSETLDGINGVSYTRTVCASLNGEELCVLIEVHGMDHSWPGSVSGISTGRISGKDLGFTGGIDMNEEMFKFFGLTD